MVKRNSFRTLWFLLSACAVPILLSSCLDRGIDPPLPPPVLPPLPEVGVLYNVAGVQGEWGDSGDGSSALKATLAMPVDMTVTPDGEILVVDWARNRIRRVTSDGLIHAFIGSGNDGDGTSGPGATADVFRPADIKLGPDMSWYVCALQNSKIKRFTGTTLECSVFAGTSRGFSGDYGLAIVAQLSRPTRGVFDVQGNFFFIDAGSSRIRRVDGETGIITTLAGSTYGNVNGIGDSAKFDFHGGDWSIHGGSPPGDGIDISPDGTYLIVGEYGNNQLRRIDIETRLVTTIAGTGEWGYSGDGGLAVSAEFKVPIDVVFSGSGDLYVADTFNHAIRKITPNGIITTVVGTGTEGFSPDSTVATEAMLSAPHGVAFDDATNTLYIADTYNNQVKRVRVR